MKLTISDTQAIDVLVSLEQRAKQLHSLADEYLQQGNPRASEIYRSRANRVKATCADIRAAWTRIEPDDETTGKDGSR